MTRWLLQHEERLDPTQRALVSRIATFIAAAELADLDEGASMATVRNAGLEICLVHRQDAEQTIEIYATAGEIVVSYGPEHEHFRPSDPADGRVWPFPSGDEVEGAATLVEGLLTGRIELEVWKRPLAVKTRSYWRDDTGESRLFLRGSTVGSYFGWSREPEEIRFDFRGAAGSE